MKKLLTAQEVADLLAVSRSSVQEWSARGEIPTTIIHSRSGRAIRRWDPDAIAEWVREKTVGVSK